MLTAYGPAVLTLFDQHDIVAELNRAAQSLDVGAMYEAAWTLTKTEVPDGDYTRYEPHFELLGVSRRSRWAQRPRDSRKRKDSAP